MLPVIINDIAEGTGERYKCRLRNEKKQLIKLYTLNYTIEYTTFLYDNTNC